MKCRFYAVSLGSALTQPAASSTGFSSALKVSLTQCAVYIHVLLQFTFCSVCVTVVIFRIFPFEVEYCLQSHLWPLCKILLKYLNLVFFELLLSEWAAVSMY